MAYTTQYIGSRYVPQFADPAEWNNTRTYEPLTIVLNGGNSYTSRQFVPVGIELTNEDYWLETGNYNAQVEQYREEVSRFLSNFNKVSFIYDTVADMKADSANLKVNDLVATKGNLSVYDQGKAIYRLKAARETDYDIEVGKLFAVNVSDITTPEMFKQKYDIDDTNSIQAALNYGNPVYLHEKEYITSSAINVPSSSRLIGHGWNCKIKNFTSDVFLIKYSRDIFFSGFGIQGNKTHNGFTISHPTAINKTNTWSMTFSNMRIEDFYYGFYIPGERNVFTHDYTSEINIYNCKIFNCIVGYRAESNQALNNILINSQIERNNSTEDKSDTPLIEMAAGEITVFNCSLIGSAEIFKAINIDKNHQENIYANFIACKCETHPNLTGSNTYLFNMDYSGIATNSRTYLNIYGCFFYLFAGVNATLILANMRNYTNVINTVSLNEMQFAYIPSIAGITGVVNEPYSYVNGTNLGRISGINFENDNYCGICKDDLNSVMQIGTYTDKGLIHIHRKGAEKTSETISVNNFINKIQYVPYYNVLYAAIDFDVYANKGTEYDENTSVKIATVNKAANSNNIINADVVATNFVPQSITVISTSKIKLIGDLFIHYLY